MTRIIPSIACAMFIAACPAMAQDDENSSAQNIAAVRACLAVAGAKEEAALAAQADAPEAKIEKSPEAYFAASAAASALEAGYARENCIGIVAYPCAEAEGYSLMGEHACIGAELEVWNALLNAAYRENLGLPPADPDSGETPEEEAAKPRAAEPVPDCQPIACDVSANDNLRKTQRAFAAWREAMCEQNYIGSQGGRENQIDISRCHMNLTARQFFWIEGGQSFER
jgi:uncharacterized protein YecT (DUF1311 family)